MPKPPARVRATSWLAILACTLLLGAFAALAELAVRSKAPTYDEPLHAVSAWLHLHDRDFRVDPEDPPLWKYWTALPNRRGDVTFPTHTQQYRDVAEDIYHEWPWVVEALYRTGDNAAHSDTFIMRSRRMMLVLAVALGVVIAVWGWQLAGPVAAVAGAVLFALDPNFLAHGALVKNDVPLTLCATALIFAVWRAGRRLTIANALAIALLCAAAVTTKFSGLLLGPIVALLLLLRAAGKEPWETFWRRIEWQSEKLLVAIAVIALAAIVSYGGIWAAYLFRFGPSPDPQVELNLRQLAVYAATAETTLELGRFPEPEDLRDWRPGLMTRAIFSMNASRFLPQPWLAGLLYTYQSALARQTYLLGDYSMTGWWYYFPLAMLFKTPTATLLALAGAAAVLVMTARQLGWKSLLTWSAACLAIPPAIILISAMRSNLNLGLRHVLPVYPFLFLGAGVAAARAWRAWRSVAPPAAGVLSLLLAIETFVAFPNFLAFFNAPTRAWRSPIDLLGDSNLDWGQDLKLVAQWQQQHPNVRLYLAYFGLADPWAYGIDYVNMPNGYAFGPKYELRTEPGVLAISATHLQGIYHTPELRQMYSRLRELEPIDVLGGTIYLYRWPPPRNP